MRILQRIDQDKRGGNKVALASVREMESEPFKAFVDRLDAFAKVFGLRQSCGWSKDWEYPWLMMCVGITESKGMDVLDIGSELSPVPWIISARNNVTIVEAIDAMERIGPQLEKAAHAFSAKLYFAYDEILPLESESFDLVTSFSVIEHQPNKVKAISEAIRVLKPGGTLAISFDVCEPKFGMTYPAENGEALTLDQFERLIWFRPEFGNKEYPAWNADAIEPFMEWHKKSAGCNYMVGAAVLKKM